MWSLGSPALEIKQELNNNKNTRESTQGLHTARNTESTLLVQINKQQQESKKLEEISNNNKFCVDRKKCDSQLTTIYLLK